MVDALGRQSPAAASLGDVAGRDPSAMGHSSADTDLAK